MAFQTKSIRPVIESRYDGFTQVEKSIADYFLKNDEITDFSAKTVARRLFVSEASISRFAKKCGFRGYREFVYQYEEGFRDQKQGPGAGKESNVLETYQELLNKTYSLLNEGQIARVVQQLYQRKRVIACGIGSSSLAAREMESRFMRIGVDIDSISETDRIRMQTVFLNRDVLVFGFSVSGETEPVLYLLQAAHERGACTVLLTSKDDPKFGAFCDEVILVASLKYLSGGNIISPQFPLLLALDIIYNQYLMQNQLEKLALHDDTMRALRSGEQHSEWPGETGEHKRFM